MFGSFRSWPLLPRPYPLRTPLQHPLRSGPRRVLRLWSKVAVHHLVTRAANLTGFERTTVNHEVFGLNRHQNWDTNLLGDEDMGGSVMRREHAANSRGCQISLNVLALVLSRARQGCSTSRIPALLVRPRWLRTAGLNLRSSLVLAGGIASRPVRSPGRTPVKQQPTHQNANPTRITPESQIVCNMQT